MQDRIYLLDLRELLEGKESQAVFQRGQKMLDAQRQKKVMRIRSRAAQAASLGAGLLIQKAVAERKLRTAFFRRFEFGELLAQLEQQGAPVQPAYGYGEHGKPYFQDIPMHFSLSHSGDYVLCAASDEEIGADIQQMRPLSDLKVAERFFAPDEIQRISAKRGRRQQEIAFYRLWVKKEAYGKLTGEGIATSVGIAMEELEQKIVWEECPSLKGYQLAVCRYGTKECRE